MAEAYTVAPVTPADYRRLAEKRLPRFLFDYIDGGANDELTMRTNLADFASVRLRQRVMRDVSGVDTSTMLAGRRVTMPLALAPVDMAGMFSRRGEVMGLRAADRAGIPFSQSTLGTDVEHRNYIDGLDNLDYWTGKTDESVRDEYLYYAESRLQAIRINQWKAPGPHATITQQKTWLYNDVMDRLARHMATLQNYPPQQQKGSSLNLAN